MFKSYTLSPWHYAAKWSQNTELNDHKVVNQLAVNYASLMEGGAKEEAFLQLVQSFHSYLMKYTLMVVKGQLPSLKTPAGKEASKMLATLLSPADKSNSAAYTRACKTLHLAFKQMTTDDVYDVMVMCFMEACNKYDPFYHTKIRQVSEYCNDFLTYRETIDVTDVAEITDFNASPCLKWLARKGFIEPIYGHKKKITSYQRGQTWPIPEETFSSEPIGFTYFVQAWFRYYLNNYITNSMKRLESKPDVLQLEHRGADGNEGNSFLRDTVQTVNGNFTDSLGVSWAADISLLNHQLDVSTLTSDWVYETEDKLFKHLTVKQRWILKMFYVDELSWVDIAKNLDCTVNTAKSQFKNVLQQVRDQI